MDLLVETANPLWFIWQGDQGSLPLGTVKRLLPRFGTEILPLSVAALADSPACEIESSRVDSLMEGVLSKNSAPLRIPSI
jgi:hypothetical protein